MNRRRAITDEGGEMMGVARAAGFHHDVGVTAQTFGNQAVVNSAGGEQSVDRQGVAVDVDITEHQNDRAGFYRRHRFVANGLQAVFQALCQRPVQIDTLTGVIRIFLAQRQQLAELAGGQHRRVDQQAIGMFGGFLEHITLTTEAGFQRHHHLLTDGIDGRVGDLSKLLAEIIIRRAQLAREHREGGVIAHRANRFHAVFGQRANHLIAFLEADLKQLLIDVGLFRRKQAVAAFFREL